MGYRTEESSLADEVIEFLDKKIKEGLPLYYEHRSGSGGFNYKKGRPDLFFVLKGLHVECELKTVSGKRSTTQDKFKWRCESQWKMLYCCPHTFKEFEDFFIYVRSLADC